MTPFPTSMSLRRSSASSPNRSAHQAASSTIGYPSSLRQLHDELDVLRGPGNIVTSRFGRVLAGVVSILALAGTLSGCGGGGGADGPPLSTAAAADRYIELVTPYNEALDSFNEAMYGGSRYVPTVHDATVVYINASEHLISGLKGTNWPADIDRDISYLIAADTRNLDATRPLAESETNAEIETWLRQNESDSRTSGEDTAGAVNAVRTKLGLPPAS
jgi:hypothetical protein